jgi:hypothetical protein
VIIDFSGCAPNNTPPAFNVIPQNPAIPFFSVPAIMNVYQVATSMKSMFVLAQFLTRYPGATGSPITLPLPIAVFYPYSTNSYPLHENGYFMWWIG